MQKGYNKELFYFLINSWSPVIATNASPPSILFNNNAFESNNYKLEENFLYRLKIICLDVSYFYNFILYVHCEYNQRFLQVHMSLIKILVLLKEVIFLSLLKFQITTNVIIVYVKQ